MQTQDCRPCSKAELPAKRCGSVRRLYLSVCPPRAALLERCSFSVSAAALHLPAALPLTHECWLPGSAPPHIRRVNVDHRAGDPGACEKPAMTRLSPFSFPFAGTPPAPDLRTASPSPQPRLPFDFSGTGTWRGRVPAVQTWEAPHCAHRCRLPTPPRHKAIPSLTQGWQRVTRVKSTHTA